MGLLLLCVVLWVAATTATFCTMGVGEGIVAVASGVIGWICGIVMQCEWGVTTKRSPDVE